MPFVKLDVDLLNSTLWLDREQRDVFITALLMAVPAEIQDPLPQLEVRAIQETGFVVPPGWYGFVHAAGPGIIYRAHVPPDAGIGALEKLGLPDLESRSQRFDGRRLVRVDGGYIVLNYMKFRDHDYTAAERQKRYRERKKDADSSPLRRYSSRNVHPNITQAEAEAYKEPPTPLKHNHDSNDPCCAAHPEVAKHKPSTLETEESYPLRRPPEPKIDASMAVSGLIDRTQLHTPKLRFVLDPIARAAEKKGEDLEEWVDRLANMWQIYMASQDKLEYCWGAEKFFGEGHYKSQATWKWKQNQFVARKLKAVTE